MYYHKTRLLEWDPGRLQWNNSSHTPLMHYFRGLGRKLRRNRNPPLNRVNAKWSKGRFPWASRRSRIGRSKRLPYSDGSAWRYRQGFSLRPPHSGFAELEAPDAAPNPPQIKQKQSCKLFCEPQIKQEQSYKLFCRPLAGCVKRLNHSGFATTTFGSTSQPLWKATVPPEP